MTVPATPLGWQNFTRDELLELVQELIDRNLLTSFEECCLQARYTVACERERVACNHMDVARKARDEAGDAWRARPTSKRDMAYSQARVAHERSRRAYAIAEKRMEVAWGALCELWERRRS